MTLSHRCEHYVPVCPLLAKRTAVLSSNRVRETRKQLPRIIQDPTIYRLAAIKNGPFGCAFIGVPPPDPPVLGPTSDVLRPYILLHWTLARLVTDKWVAGMLFWVSLSSWWLICLWRRRSLLAHLSRAIQSRRKTTLQQCVMFSVLLYGSKFTCSRPNCYRTSQTQFWGEERRFYTIIKSEASEVDGKCAFIV